MFLLAVCVPALIAAMFLSAILTRAVRDTATKKNWVKAPESDRHVHRHPTPRLGGVAVYLTFFAALCIEVAIFSFGLHIHRPDSTRLLMRILMPATFIFVGGLLDDIFSLRPLIKLAIQILSGWWLFELGCRVAVGPVRLHGNDYSWVLSGVATVLWVVMLTNAFNLIDGLDGLAAGASVFPLLTFSAVALFHHNGQMGVASIILTGALLGFLRFNFNPATIFLGDSGSLFLGFMLSALSLAGNGTKASTLLSVGLPVVACGFPIAETCVSVMRRFLSGRPVFSADREHFHHRLLKLGFTHRQVVILLFGVSGVCSLMSVLMLFPGINVLALVGITLSLLLFVGVGKLGYPEFAELGRLLLRVREQKAVIAHNVRIRNIAASVKRANSWDGIVSALGSGLREIADFSAFELAVRDDIGVPIYSRAVEFHRDLNEIAWSINLQFSGGGMLGVLSLRCPYKDESLMVDMNVIMKILKPALCHACEVVSGQHPYFAVPEKFAQTVSATM